MISTPPPEFEWARLSRRLIYHRDIMRITTPLGKNDKGTRDRRWWVLELLTLSIEFNLTLPVREQIFSLVQMRPDRATALNEAIDLAVKYGIFIQNEDGTFDTSWLIREGFVGDANTRRRFARDGADRGGNT